MHALSIYEFLFTKQYKLLLGIYTFVPMMHGGPKVPTRNANIVSEHKTSGGGHYARNDDNGSDLRLEILSAAAGGGC